MEEANKLRDIELAKLTQQEELAWLKSEHENDKEIELVRLQFEHEKLKMEQEIELTRIVRNNRLSKIATQNSRVN